MECVVETGALNFVADEYAAGCQHRLGALAGVALYRQRMRSRSLALVAIFTFGIIIWTTASSTPIAASVICLGLMAVYPLRRYRQIAKWGAIATLVLLELTMNHHVWHLFSRIDFVGGSSIGAAMGAAVAYGWDPDEFEAAERHVVRRHLALALEDPDGHGGLVVLCRGENLGLLGRDRRVAVDQAGKDTTQRLDTQRQRRHVQQQHVLDVALQHARLDRGTDGHDLIGVHTTVRFLAEEFLHGLDDLRHAGHAADQNHFVDFTGGDASVVQANGISVKLSALHARYEFRQKQRVMHELLPRLKLKRGVSNAISTVVQWAILGVGLLTAGSALGLQAGQLAIVFGALGVGIGFGLQNVVSNFVSGLILIFEQPVKVGDKVEITSLALIGEVRRIGIRASVVRTFEGAEVIVISSAIKPGNAELDAAREAGGLHGDSVSRDDDGDEDDGSTTG